MDILTGAFILSLYLTGADVPAWQRTRQVEFSTFDDCWKAATLVMPAIPSGSITCGRKDTGQVLGYFIR